MADKIDFKKTDPNYKARRNKFEVIHVPDTSYLMIDGHGDPNTSELFSQSIETLYPVAYTLKFMSKNDLGRDYVVPPLEGLWWADDMSVFTTARDKSAWDWTLMLMVPDWIDEAMVEVAIATAREKQPPRIDDLRFETLSEGQCVQTLHVGTFDDEAAILDQLHNEFVPNNGLQLTGQHHEIYLSDFRKTAPEKLRTILRQPVTAQ